MQRLHSNIKQAQKLKKYRPSYPTALYDTIYEYLAQRGGGQEVAVDVSCGMVGERKTSPLASTFGRVIAVDVNKAIITDQIKATKTEEKKPPFKMVSFKQSADLSFVRSHTIDLVAVSQAYHWLDRDRFVRQVEEALAPNGVLAVYGYGNLTTDNPDVTAMIMQYYTETVKGYWESERKYIDNHYRHFSLPLDDFIRKDGFRIEKTWPLSGLVGYLSTHTASQAYVDKHGPKELEKLYERLRLATYDNRNSSEEEETIKVTWPAFLLLGRRPKK